MKDLEKVINQLIDQGINNNKDLKATVSKQTVDSKLCSMLLDNNIDMESYTAILNKALNHVHRMGKLGINHGQIEDLKLHSSEV